MGCPILLLGQSSHRPPLEPVGGSSPKFPTLTSTLTPSMASALPFSLSCPAQGAPVPSYRPVQLFCFRAGRWISPKVLGTLKQLNFDHALPSTILSLVQHKGLLSLPTGQSYSDSLLEPVGGSAPKFPAESSISNLARVPASSLSLTCLAQGAPVPAYRRVITHNS